MINRLARYAEKFQGLLYDLTLGLVKQYRDKTVHLVKIEAATLYVKAMKLLRRQLLTVGAMMFCFTVCAVAVVVIPSAIILCLPLSLLTKTALLGILGIVMITVPLAYANRLMSEEKWMEYSKSKEILESVLENGS